jgi:hypothetical protein
MQMMKSDEREVVVTCPTRMLGMAVRLRLREIAIGAAFSHRERRSACIVIMPLAGLPEEYDDELDTRSRGRARL